MFYKVLRSQVWGQIVTASGLDANRKSTADMPKLADREHHRPNWKRTCDGYKILWLAVPDFLFDSKYVMLSILHDLGCTPNCTPLTNCNDHLKAKSCHGQGHCISNDQCTAATYTAIGWMPPNHLLACDAQNLDCWRPGVQLVTC